jgi:hypothetical protein
MTEPKRRGRPPGSRNKVTKGPPDLGPIEHPDVVPHVESWTATSGINVVVIFNAGLSATIDTKKTPWPPGWPIPQLNDVIRVGGRGGHVRYVEYDVDQGVIKITAV